MNNSPIVSRVVFFYGKLREVSVLRLSSSYENLIDVSDSNYFLGLLSNIINQNETNYNVTNNLAGDQETGKVNFYYKNNHKNILFIIKLFKFSEQLTSSLKDG